MPNGSDPTGGTERATSTRAALWERLFDAENRRSWTIEANDGIIATAGFLEGFSGAGASERVVVLTACVAVIVGGLAVAGTNWAEAAAERESQVLLAEREKQDLVLEADAELDELVRYWMSRGLSPGLARQVAEQLTAADALAAQLEWEHGFSEPMPAGLPILIGISAGVAYGLGSLIPLLIALLFPLTIEAWAIVVAVVIALTLTSLAAARAAQVDPRRMLLRSLFVGIATMTISYAAGRLLL